MTDMIRSFNELTADQQSLAGGKGGTLARLYQAGYPVPDGFVILPPAFEGDKLKPGAWAQVQAHLKRLRRGVADAAFAVRSSAMSEDAALASFAGEFETVLDVHTDEMIREAIRSVRRSGGSERVRAYSEAKGLDTAHEIAVVVQRLVRADVSGVLFTADTLFDRDLLDSFDRLFKPELIIHDCQFFTGGVHAGLAELSKLPRSMRRRMLLVHYGDNWEDFQEQVQSREFLGLAQQWRHYRP